jgi:methylated-DNA-[protein]-cysteine S-methyltransferase
VSEGIIIWTEGSRWFGALVSEKGVQKLHWSGNVESVVFECKNIRYPDEPDIEVMRIQLQLRKEIGEYLTGQRRQFSVPFILEGTEFQKTVWKAASEIPYGEVCPYGELAEKVGSPGGAQAVGQAMKNNPVPIIVPCHRVIASGGKIGGFGGSRHDVDEKVWLLEIEGTNWRKAKH